MGGAGLLKPGGVWLVWAESRLCGLATALSLVRHVLYGKVLKKFLGHRTLIISYLL